MTDTHSGSCFCGAITITAKGDPLEMGFCHCRDCQQYAGAPVVSYSLWKREDVSIVKGGEFLGAINRFGMTDRQFCTRCGGHIINDHPELGLLDVPASTLPTLAFVPSVHLHYAQAVLKIRDGLPKLREFPIEAGGSGELIAE